MRLLSGLVALMLAALPAAPKSPEMLRNEAALAMISFPWQSLDYQIVFLPPVTGYRAMTYPRKHLIEIYARPDDDPKRLAHDIAHELGHAVDVTFNTTETRNKWLKMRGIDSDTSWFTCDKCSDFSTPAGDFAETFALLQVGPEYFSGRVAAAPRPADLEPLRDFISLLTKS